VASGAPDGPPIRLLFLDVDGTLTDGVIGFTKDGDSRHFWVRDGIAMEWARDLGVRPVVISGRASLAVEARMHDLRLEYFLATATRAPAPRRCSSARARAGRSAPWWATTSPMCRS